jgi:hypothetical protein
LKRKLKELKDKFKLILGDKLIALKDKLILKDKFKPMFGDKLMALKDRLRLVLKDKLVLGDRLKELVLALADGDRMEEMRNRSLVGRLIREMAGRLRIWDFRVRRTLTVEGGIL